MATANSKTTRISNVIIDKSQGKQLRIMEDTLSMILSPYIDKLSKDRNWYSPLLALVSVATALIRFNYKDIIQIGEENAYVGLNFELLICAIALFVILVVAIFLFVRALVYLYRYRKEDLTIGGIMRDVMSLPVEEDAIAKPNDNTDTK